MAGKRQKPIDPFLQELMDERGFDDIRPFAQKYDLDERNTYYMADGRLGKKSLAYHYDSATKLKMNWEEYTRRYLRLPASS